MECRAFRTSAMQAADPTGLKPAQRAHLADCVSCRSWERQFARLDRDLGRLPVPAARPEAKERLLNRLAIAPLPGADVSPALAPVPPSRRRWFAGIAASLALGAGLWLANGKQGRAALPADPLLDSVVQCNVALAGDSGETAERKVDKLLDLARQLSDQMNEIARVDPQGTSLSGLASLYERVVRGGILEQADQLDDAARVRCLDNVLAALRRTAAEADSNAGAVPPAAVASFKAVAEAAKTGAERIRAIRAGQS